MWQPYKDVATAYLSNAIIAVDPFHVVSHLTKNFERLRIDLMNKCEYDSNQYYLLKHWSWLLTKDKVHLDNDRVYNGRFKRRMNHRDLRDMIFEAFPLLKDAYDLKEEYRYLNKEGTYDRAVEKIPKIIDKFEKADIRQFDEFVNILRNWQEEILNSFKRPYDERKLSNALSENINGKISTYLSVSNGVNNFSRFRKRVIYALSSDVNYAIKSSLTTEQRHGKKRGPYKKHD